MQVFLWLNPIFLTNDKYHMFSGNSPLSYVLYLSDARIRALAAAWARKDFKLAESFLENRDNFGLNEVLKALQLLDAGRQARVLEKKLKMLQVSKNKVKPHTLGKLKSSIDSLNKMKSPVRNRTHNLYTLFK